MTLAIGQTVVYPHHGAATIERIYDRKTKKGDVQYLTLRVTQGDLTIDVPAANIDLVGVRDVVDDEGIEKVLAVLRSPYKEEPTNWSRRFKANQEKIATGNIEKVASVVRDLTRRDEIKKLSTGEKRMLIKARQILSSELALARHIDEDEAEQRLDEILAESSQADKSVILEDADLDADTDQDADSDADHDADDEIDQELA